MKNILRWILILFVWIFGYGFMYPADLDRGGWYAWFGVFVCLCIPFWTYLSMCKWWLPKDVWNQK